MRVKRLPFILKIAFGHKSRLTCRGVERVSHTYITLRPVTRMARAGPSRTQRSQRAPQPSQSQSQRPVRGSRRVADEDDEDENTGEHDDPPDIDIDGSHERGDAEAVSSLIPPGDNCYG
jgi:hypothetical protein